MVYLDAFQEHLVLSFTIVAMAWLVSCERSEDELRVKRAVAPAFPEVMAQAHEQGRVTVKVRIGPTGQVNDAEVIEVDGKRAVLMTDEEYEQLARAWQFDSGGRSVEAEIHFTYRLMPPETMLDELGTTFEHPATVVVRGRAVIPEPIIDYTGPR